MSRRKDRERAESGIIFRDGQYVNKEDWYKAHPTREMRAAQQAEVDKAVAEEMKKKEAKPNAGSVRRRKPTQKQEGSQGSRKRQPRKSQPASD